MDIKKLQGLEGLMPTMPTREKSPVGAPSGGPSFKDTLNQISDVGIDGVANKATLANEAGVKFSNHAVERMRTRGIMYGPQDIAKLNEAVAKADAKGAKNSLVLLNDSALIVSVKNKTVVTVMDQSALKENVFTNIDSTIVM